MLAVLAFLGLLLAFLGLLLAFLGLLLAFLGAYQGAFLAVLASLVGAFRGLAVLAVVGPAVASVAAAVVPSNDQRPIYLGL